MVSVSGGDADSSDRVPGQHACADHPSCTASTKAEGGDAPVPVPAVAPDVHVCQNVLEASGAHHGLPSEPSAEHAPAATDEQGRAHVEIDEADEDMRGGVTQGLSQQKLLEDALRDAHAQRLCGLRGAMQRRALDLDQRLALRLQEEELARASNSRTPGANAAHTFAWEPYGSMHACLPAHA